MGRPSRRQNASFVAQTGGRLYATPPKRHALHQIKGIAHYRAIRTGKRPVLPALEEKGAFPGKAVFLEPGRITARRPAEHVATTDRKGRSCSSARGRSRPWPAGPLPHESASWGPPDGGRRPCPLRRRKLRSSRRCCAGRGSDPLAGLGPFSAWTPHHASCLGAAMCTAKAGSLLKASALFKMAL